MTFNRLFFFSEFISKSIPMLMIPVYIWMFGIEGFGLIGLYISIVSFLTPLVGLCFNVIVIRNLHNGERNYFYFYQAIGITFLVGTLLSCLILVARCFFDFNFDLFQMALVNAMLASIFLVFKEVFNHIGNYMIYSAVNLFFSIFTPISIIVSFYLVSFESSWIYRFYSEVITYFILVVFSMSYIIRKEVSYSAGGETSLDKLVSDILLSISFIPRTVLTWYRVMIERYYIAIMFGTLPLGYVTLGFQISNLVMLPWMIMYTYLSPKIISEYKRGSSKIFWKTMLSLFFLMIFYCLVVYVSYLLELFPNKYNQSIYYSTLILMSSIFYSLANIFLSLPTESGLKSLHHFRMNAIFLIFPLMIYLFEPNTVLSLLGISTIVSFFYCVLCLKSFLRLSHG